MVIRLLDRSVGHCLYNLLDLLLATDILKRHLSRGYAFDHPVHRHHDVHSG
jgi:hypothetical protein